MLQEVLLLCTTDKNITQKHEKQDYRVDDQNRISWNFLAHTFEQAFRRLEYVKNPFFLTT